VRTREELQTENNDLRAELRLVLRRDTQPWSGAREMAASIRAEAQRSVVPDFRNGLLLAAGMLKSGNTDD
jgi:hypothetical protein